MTMPSSLANLCSPVVYSCFGSGRENLRDSVLDGLIKSDASGKKQALAPAATAFLITFSEILRLCTGSLVERSWQTATVADDVAA